VRIVLLVVSVALVVFALVQARGDRACTQARNAVFALAPGPRGDRLVEPTLARLQRDCAAAAPLVAASGVLQAVGRPGAAIRLATTATRREPQDARAWAALARAREAAGDVAGARRAHALVAALNPLAEAARPGAGAAPRPAPAAGADP